jgi:putative multiple sugar transport system permease protein
MWLLGGQNIGPFPPGFQMIASGFIPDILGSGKPNILSLVLGWGAAIAILWMQISTRKQQEKMGVADEPFAFFAGKNAIIFIAIVGMTWGLANFRGLPNVFIVMAVLVGLYAFISERTTVGRRIYAIGGNAKAAKLSGINSERVVFLTFANMGMLAALAGVVVSARLNSATPKAGVAFELDAIAAVFVGGASMSGGVGTVIGAVVGAFIMGVMNNGMSILGIGIDYQQVIKGLVLMAAVIFDVSNKSKS